MKLPDHLVELAPETLYLPLTQGCASALSFGQGPVVLCLHGFPDNCLSYRYQVEPLVRAGYQVILPVMRGYQPSSVQGPGAHYMVDLATDALRWIEALQQERVHLVGHDWGGVVAWALAGLAPERLHTLTSIAIPYLKNLPGGVMRYPNQFVNSWYMGFFQWRGVADWVISQADSWFIRMLWRRWSPDYDVPEEVVASVTATFQQAGVRESALDYYRCAFKLLTAPGRESSRLLQCRINVPTLLITGANDGCIDTRLFEATTNSDDFPAGVAIERIQGAGHFAHLEKPDLVNGLLLQHFSR